MVTENNLYSTDEGLELFSSINGSVRRGITKEEYEEIKDRLVAPDLSAAELIHTWLKVGYIKWKGDKLVTDLRSQHLLLDEKTEDALREKSLKTGMTTKELIMSFIQKSLEEPEKV